MSATLRNWMIAMVISMALLCIGMGVLGILHAQPALMIAAMSGFAAVGASTGTMYQRLRKSS